MASVYHSIASIDSVALFIMYWAWDKLISGDQLRSGAIYIHKAHLGDCLQENVPNSTCHGIYLISTLMRTITNETSLSSQTIAKWTLR
jgi:hypothetical protein